MDCLKIPELIKTNNVLTDQTKKKRKRLRTKAIRFDLKHKLEQAILSPESNVRDLFIVKEDGILQAPLVDVLERLGIYEEFSSFSIFTFESISKITRIFKIEKQLKSEDKINQPPDAKKLKCLRICVNSKVYNALEEKTVYVDNLPPQCSETKLRRRAVVFGTVANIFLPKIPRIQHCFSSATSFNSGFGFIQFASKTAAKRFCKRYALNSRLKRGKHTHCHHHKKKHNKNLNEEMKESKIYDNCDNLEYITDLDYNESTFRTMAATSFEFYHKEMLMEQQNVDDKTVISNYLNSNEIEKENAESKNLISNETSDINNEQSFNLKIKNEISNDLKDKQLSDKLIFRSLYDSGNDTENENLNSLLINNKKESATAETKKKRKKRFRNTFNHIGSLTNLFKRIQVIPLKQYRDLRSEYLRLRKERILILKQFIESASFEKHVISIPAKKVKNKSRKNQKSNKQKLFEKAQKIKELEFLNN